MKFGLGRGLGALISRDEDNDEYGGEDFDFGTTQEDFNQTGDSDLNNWPEETESENDVADNQQFNDSQEVADGFIQSNITEVDDGQAVTVKVKKEDPGLEKESESLPGDRLGQLPVESVSPNPYQPRRVFKPELLQELADSIKEHGVIQPLIVTETGPDRYELISGERRLQAAKLAGLTEVPALIRQKAVSSEQKLELAIIENVQRADLNIIEEARAYKRLNEEFGLTYEQVAGKVGKSRPAVSNIVRLLQLPVEIQRGLIDGKITEGHGRALLQVAERERQLSLYNLILEKKLPTDQAFALSKQWTARPELRKEHAVRRSDEIEALENMLKKSLGAKKVDITFHTNGGGTLKLIFLGKEELQAMIDRLSE